jgi:hypothetical protein
MPKGKFIYHDEVLLAAGGSVFIIARGSDSTVAVVNKAGEPVPFNFTVRESVAINSSIRQATNALRVAA